MERKIYFIILLWLRSLEAKDPELPLCPSNIEFLPQKLPMHCRMPNKSDLKNLVFPMGFPGLQGSSDIQSAQPGSPPSGESAYPGGASGLPVPLPGMPGINGPGISNVPSQFLGMPGMPGPLPGMPGMPSSLPGMERLPGPMPMGQKLPVVVMPYYSPDPAFKQKDKHRKPYRGHRKRPRHYDTESSDSEDSESSDDGNGRRNMNYGKKQHRIKRKQKLRNSVLTPLLQYVTKDGYVIYEKTLSNGEVKSWMDNKNVEKHENVGRKTNADEQDVGDNSEKNPTQEHEVIEQEDMQAQERKHQGSDEHSGARKNIKIKQAKQKLVAKQRHIVRKDSKPQS